MDDEALVLEALKGLTDWRATHRQVRSKLFFNKPAVRRKI